MDYTWILTFFSLFGTILNVQKYIECFYVWAIGDMLWFLFDMWKSFYGRAFLDFIQIGLSIWGLYKWRKNN